MVCSSLLLARCLLLSVFDSLNYLARVSLDRDLADLGLSCYKTNRLYESITRVILDQNQSRLRDRRGKGRGIPTIKSKLIKRKRRSGLCRAFGVLGLTTERRDGLKEKETKIAVARERDKRHHKNHTKKRATEMYNRPHCNNFKSGIEETCDGRKMKSIDSFAGKVDEYYVQKA
ncbi:hypothetical protein Tco_1203662 [Tanacetum coccineum]